MKFLVTYQDHTKKVVEGPDINHAAAKAVKARKELSVVLAIEPYEPIVKEKPE
jgi:hypothetical protein